MFTKEVKIGITAIIAILIVYFGIIFLKGVKLSHTDNVYYVRMKNVNGLLVAGDVICNGLKIGSVKNMNYDSKTQEIIVAAELNDGFSLTRGSYASIQKDMLGAPKLNISLGDDPSLLLGVGDTINGLNSSGDLISAAGDMIPSIQAIIPKIDSLIEALNDIARSPALSASLENVNDITSQLRTTSVQLDGMMKELSADVPGVMKKVSNVATNLETTTNNLSRVDVAGLTTTANQTLQNANTAIENVSGLADNAGSLVTNLNYKLSDNHSTLGMLLNDNNAYYHLDSTLHNASNLMLDLKQNPKRYVHFSIFGKKK